MPGRPYLAALLLVTSLLLAVTLRSETLGLDPHLESVLTVYRQDGAEEALPQFERLARDFGKAGKSQDKAAAIHYVGECHWRLGNFAEAHRHLDHALNLERAAKDRAGEARTL